MFEGNFMEKNQSIIKLQDVDYKSLCIILTLIKDQQLVVEDEDLLLVLQTACMLQFARVREFCIERINEVLKVDNCLKVWIAAESLDLTQLYLKAKNLSLTEFDCIKDIQCFLELNLKQLHDYLANIFLCVKNEIDVFTSCMRWWYENSSKEAFVLSFKDTNKIFYYFLTFLDFNRLSNNDIKEIMTYPDVNTANEIITVLRNIIKIRNCDLIGDNVLSREAVLLNCKRRIRNNYPCILIDRIGVFNPYGYGCTEDILASNVNHQGINVKNLLLYDQIESNFKHVLHINTDRLYRLNGLHILGYKELIFFFGGEFSWVRGNWNENFWVFDTYRDRWERKAKMPRGRRHFESCIIGDVIYIVGGTGKFRVVQDNMFSYNYKLDVWSNLVQLPCIGRQIKCCEYKDQLFLLSAITKCGYIYNVLTNSWIELRICDTDSIVSNFSNQFVIFSYKDYIYIKGSSIIKLQPMDNKLQVVSTTFHTSINCDFIQSTICNGEVYTIYNRTTDETHSIVFERYKVDQGTSDVILECEMDPISGVKLCGQSYAFNRDTKLFNLSHYSIVEKDIYLTDFVL
ncbi:hypothetical protein Trydic_g6503 [Trypoxylus dichotomus]